MRRADTYRIRSLAPIMETLFASHRMMMAALGKTWGGIWTGTTPSRPKPRPPKKPRRLKGKAVEAVPNPTEVKAEEPKPKASNSFDRKQAMDFGYVFDEAFGTALATMLGNIKVVKPKGNALVPPEADRVEVGLTRIVGAIRPQDYDAAYRPDGSRMVTAAEL